MKEIDAPMVDRIVERFRALGDATRIRILVRLQAGKCNVTTLAQELGAKQASMSKHLAVLRNVGFIEMKRVGAQAFCSALDPALPTLCRLMCDGIVRHAKQQRKLLGL